VIFFENEEKSNLVRVLQGFEFNLPDWIHKLDPFLKQIPNFEAQNKNIYLSFSRIKTAESGKTQTRSNIRLLCLLFTFQNKIMRDILLLKVLQR
jgi:hypothetical protein